MNPIINNKDEFRFWKHVGCLSDNGRWEWVGVKNGPAGYGMFFYKGRKRLAHRFSYELYRGNILNKLTIDHLCRNRACVNPSHLEVVPMRENILRGNSSSARNAKKTHCPQGHEYDHDNTLVCGGIRKCRACNRNRTSERRARQPKEYKVMVRIDC